MSESIAGASLKRTLGPFSVLLFGLAFLAPLIVFGTYGVITQASGNTTAMAYLIAAIGVVFTALSYGRLVRVFPVAGSAYTYTRKMLSANLGFMVGWAALLDYFFIPMLIWLLGASYLNMAFPEVPQWVWIIGFIILTTVLNVVGIKVADRVNLILMSFQILVIVFFLIVRLLADHLQAANRATFHRRHSRRARLGFVIIDFGRIRRVETLLDEISAFWLFHDSLQLGRRKRVHQTRLRHHQKQHLRTGQRCQLVCFLHDTGLALGQRVCALLPGGGYAEYCVAPAGQCLPVPAALSVVEAAAIPETLFTVWTNLFERAYVQAGDAVLVQLAQRLRGMFRETDSLVRWGGEEVLVLGAAGGVGLAAIEVAAALGARRAGSGRPRLPAVR